MEKINIMKDFKWDNSPEWFRSVVEEEIFHNKIYEKLFTVEEGDVVLDVGASVGPFAYSILPKNPKHVICIEPGVKQFHTLVENTQYGNVTCLNKSISHADGIIHSNTVYGSEDTFIESYGMSFQTLINQYNLDRIDFLKTDCEGGEYDIFNSENLVWIKQNVKKIVGEWHLSNPELNQKFREFRDTYLRIFPNHQCFSVDGHSVNWDLWNEHFLEYYHHVIIYIDNR
jgi:FkbM family methyltransferase